MNLKKNLLKVIAVILFAIFAIAQTKGVYAHDQEPAVWMGLIPLMTNDEPNTGYSINIPGQDGAAQIWNIVRYQSESAPSYIDEVTNIYCVKSGIGFTNDTLGADGKKKAAYDRYYDMKTEREAISSQNTVLNQLVTKEITETSLNYNRYNALLALLDELYLPGKSTENEKKELIYKLIQIANERGNQYNRYVNEELIKAFDLPPDVEEDLGTFLSSGSPTQYALTEYAPTDDDIKAVQQAAIWYFTNYGEDDGKYDKFTTSDRARTNWLYYSLTGTSDYDHLSSYPTTGTARNCYAELLYNYLIKEAKENASKYAGSSSDIGAPIKIDKKVLKRVASGEDYIIGPFNIEQLNSRPYTLSLEVKNGESGVTYTLLNGNKEPASGDLKSLVGKGDFYIKVKANQADNLTMTFNGSYSKKTMKLWASNANGQAQPLAELDKQDEPINEIFKLQPEDPFDLALRKYITKINGTPLTEQGKASRVPVIEKSTIDTYNTATYNHKKDPVIIKTGDEVTYEITIYNEGKKPGYATKIIDQLPTGLEYVEVESGNFVKDTYSTTDNKLTLKRADGNKTDLPAYNGSELKSETIAIKCRVTATPDTKNKKVLTNIAWIAEEYDSQLQKPIENDVGDDIDSEPGTTPKINNANVNKDNMSDYTGYGNKNDLTDSGFYYKGQQDDDDFEKLVLLPEAFDLKLIKFITAVNGEAVPNRVKSVDASKLNTLDTSGNMITTADYTLEKNPVGVAKGDIVTYTFRIYNEGTIDGFAEEITEDVPEGLEFIWSDKTDENLDADNTYTQEEKEAIKLNQDNLWGSFKYDKPGGKITQVSSNYLSKSINEGNLITAFGRNDDGTKTEEDLHYKELKIAFKVVSENVSGTIIRNEAEISEDADSKGQTVDDRDSDTEQWKKEPSGSYYDDDNKWPKYKEDDEDYDNLVLKAFDLSLRKFIIAVSDDQTINDNEYLKDEDGSYTREPEVDTSKLNTIGPDGKMITTSTYNHPKTPVEVEQNDIVVYMLRVYNEGDIDGYAAEIKDHLPPYLQFLDNDYNKQYGWTVSSDGRTVTTKYLENELIRKAMPVYATGYEPALRGYTLSYKEVPIMCKVTRGSKPSEPITNIADITKYLNSNKETVTDRDSKENNVVLPKDENLPGYKDNETGSYVPGQEDDDDFEKVVIKPFDLALRKFIIAVSKDETISDSEYLKDANGAYTRAPQVDTSKLNTTDENGKMITTATYNHPKTPVEISKNDIVVYMLRAYNEGDVDGYAAEIKDHLPSYLQFLDNDFNKQYGWTVSSDGRTVTTEYLENEKIVKAEKTSNGYTLSYKEVPIMCKITDEAKTDEPITNIADITKYLDGGKEQIDDRDSGENNVVLPPDEDLPGYKDEETGPYVPGQEDDDDFEKVVIKPFDLALRKFITKIEDKVVDSRIPQVNYDKENDKITYEHDKDPLTVVSGNIVEYTIRIFNEGARNGYASQVLDDIPDGLVFLPDNSTNTEYRWTMYRKAKQGETGTIVQDGEQYVETKDPEEAEVIVTDYLSKEQGEERMQDNSENAENPNLLKAFDKKAEISDTNPDFRDIKVAFKVIEPNSSSRVIVNAAQISEDKDEHGEDVDDDDSEPGKWNEGEDDQDKEYIELREFDLALRKWVTQAIVIDNGKQTVTQTGHKPYDDPEQVVKVEIVQSKLNKVTVKFRYSIRVINEGDIEGYAKEVTDYVPKGLKFIAADNPGWKDEGNNVISTRLLENKLLKPGEYADVEVVLTWINSESGLGTVMTNTAEISEDDNPYDVPDRDSTPDNKKHGEDDIDDAPVILSIKTGQAKIYFALGFTILITTGLGIVLIKKYVL